MHLLQAAAQFSPDSKPITGQPKPPKTPTDPDGDRDTETPTGPRQTSPEQKYQKHVH